MPEGLITLNKTDWSVKYFKHDACRFSPAYETDTCECGGWIMEEE